MDARTAEQLLYADATLREMAQLAARGRDAYDSDIAVKRACQYNIIRLRRILSDLVMRGYARTRTYRGDLSEGCATALPTAIGRLTTTSCGQSSTSTQQIFTVPLKQRC